MVGGLDDKSKRLLEAAREKGASSWLSTPPLKQYGYCINKQEFKDALCLRYGWQIPNTPKHCGCGKENSIDHVLTCMKGGYVHMRHNALRDSEAKLMEEVCLDVRKEPPLIEINRDDIRGNKKDKARLDVSGIGVWSQYEKVFVDIRVTHPNAPSHIEKPLEKLYLENEASKKAEYNDRVINVEKATFSPLVFTTTGGMGPECTRFNQRLAELIAKKRNERYSDIMRYIRNRLRFALLKATLHAIRGVRGRGPPAEEAVTDISFNLIPTADGE